MIMYQIHKFIKKEKKKNIMKSDLGLNPVSPFSQMRTWTIYLMYLMQHDSHESLVSLSNDIFGI